MTRKEKEMRAAMAAAAEERKWVEAARTIVDKKRLITQWNSDGPGVRIVCAETFCELRIDKNPYKFKVAEEVGERLIREYRKHNSESINSARRRSAREWAKWLKGAE